MCEASGRKSLPLRVASRVVAEAQVSGSRMAAVSPHECGSIASRIQLVPFGPESRHVREQEAHGAAGQGLFGFNRTVRLCDHHRGMPAASQGQIHTITVISHMGEE